MTLPKAAAGQPHTVSNASPPSRPEPVHELGLAAAARALRDGEISAEDLSRRLLERAHAHAGLNAFITIDEAQLLEAAHQADRALRAGRSAPCWVSPSGSRTATSRAA